MWGMSNQGYWTPQEIQFLDDFFAREDGPENFMDTAMLDGYLTAVASGPTLIMPSEMLRWVWDTEKGEEDAGFKNQKEAQKIIRLIMRQWNAIIHNLTHAPDQFEPQIYERVLEDGQTIPIIDEWCMGFYKGMSLDKAGWAPLLLSQPDLLMPVLMYGMEDGWDALEKLNHDQKAHQAVADSLSGMVCQVHAHWLAQRQQQHAAGQMPQPLRRSDPVRREGIKLGRNDPCHCGSGRKYKHCHASH